MGHMFSDVSIVVRQITMYSWGFRVTTVNVFDGCSIPNQGAAYNFRPFLTVRYFVLQRGGVNNAPFESRRSPGATQLLQ